MSSINSTQTVRTLDTNQRFSSIRLKVLRIGHEIVCGINLSTRVKKLILMDNEGVQIGAIMFNGDIDNFVRKFEVDKTYLISNGEVRQVYGRYPSIHPEKELILKKYTVVTETFDSIDMKIQYNFVEFKDIESKFDKKEDFDVFGTLVRVENSKMVPMKTTSGAH
ncbi:uncharacterized protein LOC131007175 [Salvia miltiorrhiza]|uniref:uncharacterized protein LOC131007175 n=1 Tax=Salvia miltiorrhiza TaxID=226208 RepID=UPI0025AC587F|nr:uncharacterized protein LOC131007175 [Salvia miltiorrhiza]